MWTDDFKNSHWSQSVFFSESDKARKIQIKAKHKMSLVENSSSFQQHSRSHECLKAIRLPGPSGKSTAGRPVTVKPAGVGLHTHWHPPACKPTPRLCSSPHQRVYVWVMWENHENGSTELLPPSSPSKPFETRGRGRTVALNAWESPWTGTHTPRGKDTAAASGFTLWCQLSLVGNRIKWSWFEWELRISFIFVLVSVLKVSDTHLTDPGILWKAAPRGGDEVRLRAGKVWWVSAGNKCSRCP